MTDDQIKHMVNRFLMWKLPEHFNPDNGISFDPLSSKGTPYERRREPVGTNLLDAEQAAAMVRHMIEGMEPDERHMIVAFILDRAKDDRETGHGVASYALTLVARAIERGDHLAQESLDKAP